MSDTLNILRHPISALAKTWNADGTITGYGDAKFFNRREARVNNLGELSTLLDELEDQSTTVLIRGRYVGDRLARERDGAEYKSGKVRRALDYFDDQPLHTLLVDIDKFQPLAFDPITHPQQAIDEYLQTMLPDAFCVAGYHWQLSNSHGHSSKGGTLNAHVWMWSDTAYSSAQLRAHAAETSLATDTSLFNPVQAHYTAAPVFDGVDDPLTGARSGFVPGVLGDALDLQLSAEALRATGAGGGRGARLREQAEADPIARMLRDKGMVKSQRQDGGLNITCPFNDEHTGASGETATQYFLPNTGGYAVGSFKCLHAHCGERTRGQFLSRLGFDEHAPAGESFDDVRTDADIAAGVGSGSGAGAPSPTSVGARPKKLKVSAQVPVAQHLCTDLANANRVSKYFGDKLIVVNEQWHTWSGKCWVKEDGDVYRDTALLSKLVKAEAEGWRARPAPTPADATRHEAMATALDKHGTKCESKAAIEAAIGLLKKMLTVKPSTMDCDPYLWNCANGTVDLRTKVLKPHDPKQFITRIVDIDYVPNATCTTWQEVLLQITREDGLGDDCSPVPAPLAEFLQRWFGYCMTGSVIEHKMVVLYGQGSNGKSTIVDIMSRVMGDYSGTAAPGLLMATKSDKHPAEVADLNGMRMVTAHETGEGGMLREDFVKSATGGDKIKARFMRENFFEFVPTHKLQLLTNHKPGVKGQDNGIWRRLLLVPFEARFGTSGEVASGVAHHLKDIGVMARLELELEGVMAWAIAGAADWAKNGLNPPALVLLASEDYQGEQDRVLQYVDECCQCETGAKTPLTGQFGIFESYREWCKQGGFNPMSKLRLRRELERVVPGCKMTDERDQSKGGDGRRKQLIWGVRVLEGE